MEEILHQILEPVLHDLEATGAPYPRIEELDSADDPDQIGVMLLQVGGHGAGALASRSDTYFEQVASIADHTQEWVQESFSGNEYTNWPSCPRHPGTHPMEPIARADAAVWHCPRDKSFFFPIGTLK